MALPLDHNALEHLHAATSPLDDLEVHLHAVTGREAGNTSQLRALDAFDDAAHVGQERRMGRPGAGLKAMLRPAPKHGSGDARPRLRSALLTAVGTRAALEAALVPPALDLRVVPR